MWGNLVRPPTSRPIPVLVESRFAPGCGRQRSVVTWPPPLIALARHALSLVVTLGL